MKKQHNSDKSGGGERAILERRGAEVEWAGSCNVGGGDLQNGVLMVDPVSILIAIGVSARVVTITIASRVFVKARGGKCKLAGQEAERHKMIMT